MHFRSFAIFHAHTQGFAQPDAIWLFTVTSFKNITIKILTVSRENHEITSILQFDNNPTSCSV
jgi:hypothetical protein